MNPVAVDKGSVVKGDVLFVDPSLLVVVVLNLVETVVILGEATPGVATSPVVESSDSKFVD